MFLLAKAADFSYFYFFTSLPSKTMNIISHILKYSINIVKLEVSLTQPRSSKFTNTHIVFRRYLYCKQYYQKNSFK